MFEAGYCDELRFLQKVGDIARYEIQHRVEVVVKGKKICNHYVDFLVFYPDGRAEFHETKGYDTDVWKLKKKLTEALFPDIPYIIKRQGNTFRPKRKWGRR